MGPSCSWKQLFAVGSTTEVKQTSFEQRSSCKAPTLARYVWSLFKWNGRDCDGSKHYAIGLLQLSCDYVLKFDWYCQLSGSGSNSAEVARPFLLRPGNEASIGSVFAHLSCVGQCNCYKRFSSTVLPFHRAGWCELWWELQKWRYQFWLGKWVRQT